MITRKTSATILPWWCGCVTAKWRRFYQERGIAVLETDAKSGKGVNGFVPAVRELLKDKLESYAAKGQVGRPLRVMILGIPNVGKSSLVNRLCGTKKARVEDRPGVTLSKQWVSAGRDLDLLDMPGVLWPKFEDPETGKNLAFTGAIKSDVMDTELLAIRLLELLCPLRPAEFIERYKLTDDELSLPGHELLSVIARHFVPRA